MQKKIIISPNIILFLASIIIHARLARVKQDEVRAGFSLNTTAINIFSGFSPLASVQSSRRPW